MKIILRIGRTIFLIGCIAAPSMAMDLGETTEIHGFGGWSYGQTDGNYYLTGSEEGEYSNADFYLNIRSQPTEKLSISAQVGWINDAVESDVDFDFAFAEYAFSDAIKARMGRVKQPWGIYGELQRVGTLRPFLTLPQGIYGNFGFIGNGYNGVGLTGQVFTEGGWGFGYDLYGGQLRNDLEIQNLLLFPFFNDPIYLNDGVARFEEKLNDMIGFRVDISTPVSGLRFGLSGYTGTLDSELFDEGTDRTLLGAHIEYMNQGLMIRAEYMDFDQKKPTASGTDVFSDSYYLEAAYRFTDHWELAARYDVMDQELISSGVSQFPRVVEESTQHKDLAFGVNYWFNSHFAIKASYHMVTGLRFARLKFDDPLRVLLAGDFDEDTDLFQFGAHFSF